MRINYNISEEKMFDLGRQNYLIPIPTTQSKSRTNLQLQNQIHDPSNEAKLKDKSGKGKKKEASRNGKWTLRQRMRYLLFLEQHQALFYDTQTRKREKVFSKMSKHIKSRKTSQCKSHHQKALKIHQNRQNLSPLKREWRQFIRTEERVLINSFPQVNKNQEFYRILQFSDVVKIQVNTEYIESYF